MSLSHFESVLNELLSKDGLDSIEEILLAHGRFLDNFKVSFDVRRRFHSDNGAQQTLGRQRPDQLEVPGWNTVHLGDRNP